MVGYECLAGRRAFDGDNSVTIALRHLRDQPDPLPAEVPAGVRTLIERATVKDPAQRFPDGAAVVEAIDELKAGRVLAPVQHTDTQSFWLLPDAAALAGAAPATGASPTAGGRAPGGARGRMLVPLAALLVGAGLAALVLQAVTPTAPATTAATVEVTGTATPSAEPILVEPADFLGRPVDAVRAQLEAMGLVVQLQEVQDRDADPGTVVDVAPLSARLEPGQTVLVSYAVAPQSRNSATTRAPRAPADSVVETSDEATRTPTPSVTATPTPTPTPTPTDTPTPTPTVTPTTSASDTTAPDDDEDDDDWGDEETDTPVPTTTPTDGGSSDGGTLR
jgi:eukaryotic-like serine/threonine-protein kinase